MSCGFTIKDGQTDLKQYVYDAAFKLQQHLEEEAKRALFVISQLDSGQWKITRMLPSTYLTQEANTKHAYMVERQDSPYCDNDGMRFWTGPTAYDALLKAIASLEMNEKD